LDTSLELDNPINQDNLIEWYKGTKKWLVNDIRNSKFITHYYSGVNNSEWSIKE